jgi:hypothetical protein
MKCRRNKTERPVGKPKHTWKDNIKTGVQETGHQGADWIQADMVQ